MAIPRYDPSAILRRRGHDPATSPTSSTSPSARPGGQGIRGRELMDKVKEAEAAIVRARSRTSLQRRDDIERQRVVDVTDSEYWVAVCFESRAQKEEWLKATGLYRDGDKYLDGRKVAAAMGITLTPDPGSRRSVSVNPRWSKHVREE